MYTCANIQMKSTIGQNILCSKSLQMFCGKCYILSGMSVQDLCDTFEHTLSLLYPLCKNCKNRKIAKITLM